MPLRFEQAYKIKRGTNLGDPKTWDNRFQDIDLRLAAREMDASDIQNALNGVQALALSRMNDTIVPLILDAQTRLANFGALFSASSESSVAFGTGTKEFVLTEETRQGWVFVDYVSVRVATDETKSMIGRVESYERETGLLTVDVLIADGIGTFADWVVGVSTRPDLVHSTRTDNPHATTAAQVGAYTTGEADAILATKANLNSPTFTGNTRVPTHPLTVVDDRAASAAYVIAAIVDALAGSPDIGAVLSALDNRVRYDAGQALSQAQKDQALRNIGAWTTGDGKITLKSVSDPGWVMMNDGTIGDATSGASARANADCVDLFALLWNNVDNTGAPVVTGRGGSAASDWAAHKKITLTRQLGRSIAIAGAGVGLTARLLGRFDGSETHTQTVGEMPVHAHGVTDPTHTHGVNDSGHIHGVLDPLHLHLLFDPGHYHAPLGMASFAGLSGAATTAGSASDTISIYNPDQYSYSTATSLSNLSVFAAPTGILIAPGYTGVTNQASGTGISIQNAGSGSPMDIMNPRAYWNVMIKL